MSPYIHLVRTSFLKLMAYRMRYLTGIATYAIFVGVQYFVWKAVFAARAAEAVETADVVGAVEDLAGTQGADALTNDVASTLQGEAVQAATVGGLEFERLISYLAVGYIARAAYYNNLDSDIAERFQTGDVTMDLLKPLDFHGNYLAQALGETSFRLLFFALPMSIVIVPLFGVAAPTGDGWWQFPLLFLGAFIINAELSLLAGSATFFLEDSTGLMSLKRNVVMVASGLMVPLHFLSAVIGDAATAVLMHLPFAFIGYYPVLAYVGAWSTTAGATELGALGGPTDFHQVLLWAVLWMVVMRLANVGLWAYACRRLEVQGG